MVANLLMRVWYPLIVCFQRMLLRNEATASSAPGSEHRAAAYVCVCVGRGGGERSKD